MAQSAAALPANLDLYLHVRVLIALILGLSVTRLVSGIAALVQHPGRYRIWPVHLGWVAWAPRILSNIGAIKTTFSHVAAGSLGLRPLLKRSMWSTV